MEIAYSYFMDNKVRTHTHTNTTNFSICFYSSGSSDIVQQSWALLGKKAALSCNIKPNDPNEQLATVLWYRGAHGEPIFT